MTQISEKTHSLVSLPVRENGSHFSMTLRESMRLIRDEQNQDYSLYVLHELGQSTEYFELRQQLRKNEIDIQVVWCDRAEIEKLSHQFSDSGDETEGSSDYQNLNLTLIADATAQRGSDIHFRIESRFTRVLYRIDGNMRQVRTESVEWGTRLVNTLYNSMSEEQSHTSLSYTEPCDARVKEQFVNGYGLSTIRFASRPGGQGRLAVALRLVSRRKQTLNFNQLGLRPAEENTLRRTLTSSGATLFSGPTGHGKSTVCQCSAEWLAAEDPGENILSVEDPIESPIDGVFQTPKGKQTYAEGVENLLRMDPDRLYVGEIRSPAAANAVIEAVNTGTPLLSTIHTNSAADILHRLRGFGVDNDLLFDPTIVSGLVGLRLVPLLCNECKIPWHEGRSSVSPVMQEMVESHADISKVYLRRPGGCSCCGGTGIKGRTAVFEVIETDNVFMRIYNVKGKLAAYLDWIDKGGVTLCQNLTNLINEGLTDPVWAHRRICNLDRDTRLKAGAEM
ncbi:GspE/PulE family protein [Erwinia tasmaniensis]|uniref:Type IV pilus protein n=1 Tax=Erwinia tasmaniensis (strain DSM 17950 / CFBP 7177 / CIP 109463 / NCPPB 4357 / Et1/99) TaxID=465817 RepID=B2VAW1_ERWT9|nr:ATPase, T2SS/T4P/T4SS family [Erwinia tasmaniensis]CAO94864.1 Type IV pilus protein [Erwinia tasmaniensis Et1/99]